jgi:hypothetical protein
MMSGRRLLRAGLVAAVALTARSAFAQVTATVTVPVGVTFNVADVASATTGTPNPVQVSYSNCAGIASNKSLLVSVKADATAFSGPGAVHIAAMQASWTATVSGNGTGFNGTLSSTTYTQVYRKNNPCSGFHSGSVNLVWALAPIAAAGLRSGTHTLTIRWKFESF